MDWWLLTFLLGSILSLFLPIVPELFYVGLFLAAGIILIFIPRVRFSSGLFFGFSWVIFAGWQYDDIWHSNHLDAFNTVAKPIVVVGKVVNIPTQKNIVVNNDTGDLHEQYRFLLMVEELNQQQLVNPIKLRLRWDNPEYKVLQGQRLKLNVKIKPSYGLSNTGTFHYKTWLRSQHIHATGYVIAKSKSFTLDSEDSLRQKLYVQQLALIGEHPKLGLLQALSFGQRSNISTEQWQILQATTTQHLIAISGLHLGLVASTSYLLLMLISRIAPVRHVFKSQHSKFIRFSLAKVMLIVSAIITCYYAYLAGFSMSTVRALVMLIVYLIARLFFMQLTMVRSLLIVVFILLIIEPFSLLSISFWLSISAVAIILTTLWRFELSNSFGASHWLKSLLLIQLSLSLLMLPLTIFVSQQLSAIAIIANVIAVPLLSISAIPLALFGVIFLPFLPFISTVLFDVSLASLELVWQWLMYLSSLSWAVIPISYNVLVGISLALLLLMAWLLIPLTKWKWLTVVSGIVVYFSYRLLTWSNPQDWKVTILDVGQGLSVAITKNNHLFLYDTGANYPSGFNLAEGVVKPWVINQGFSAIDWLMVSHSDNDHSGGVSYLSQQFPIKRFTANDKKLAGSDLCLQGKQYIWQGLQVNTLWPETPVGRKNNHSCVVRISDGKTSVLLTGDISSTVERKLIKQYGKNRTLNSSVLVVPHHGSKSSSSDKFIQAVSPDYAVFSSGFLNRWDMPTAEISKRYTDKNIKIFQTNTDGMIEFSMSTQGVKTATYNKQLWPFWFAR